jgi:hypothetical protein
MKMKIISAATILLTGALVASAKGQDWTGMSQDPLGSVAPSDLRPQPADPLTAAAIRSALVSVVRDALMPGQFSKSFSCLTWLQGNPRGKVTHVDTGALDHALAQWREDYKLQYGQTFGFTASSLKISEIDITPGAKLALVWLPLDDVASNGLGMNSLSHEDRLVPPPAAKWSDRMLIVMENQGTADSPRWTIDTPRDLTEEQLAQRCATCAETLLAGEPVWPNQAAMVTRQAVLEVLEALLNTSASG